MWPSETTRAKPELAAVRRRTGRPTTRAAVGDQLVHQLARRALGPVARREEGMHGGPVDTGRVVVEHEATVEHALHRVILPAGAQRCSGTVLV